MKKHIPNTITLCNLMCGCVAVCLAYRREYDMALWFIVLGALFDFFDGFAARRLGVSSPIGKELDSLADAITFGLAPAMMLYSALNLYLMIYANCTEATSELSRLRYMSVAAFLVAAFSALRLAKFNIDERQTSSFIGLPTPANALLVASVVITLANNTDSLMPIVSRYMPVSLLCIIILGVLIATSCTLLVCELPMFALKFKHFHWTGNEVRYIFLLSSAALLTSTIVQGHGRFIASIGGVIAWYVLLSLLYVRKFDK